MLRWISLFCALIILPGHAQVLIKDATLRLLPPLVPNTSAYFTIENSGDEPETVVSVNSDIARNVEIHNHVMTGETMRMERLNELTLSPGQSITFSPSGLHLMVFGLKQTLVEDQAIKFNLTTKSGLNIAFDAIVVRP